MPLAISSASSTQSRGPFKLPGPLPGATMSLMGASNPVPSTSLFVDHFQLSDATRRLHPGAVFCLTHCHSDHMVGLSPHWKLGDLHTSTSTAPFLQRKFGVGLPLKTHPMDEPFSVWDPKSRMTLTCTFVDAGHCPGSVMLICEGFANGRGPVIHTCDLNCVKMKLCDVWQIWPLLALPIAANTCSSMQHVHIHPYSSCQ